MSEDQVADALRAAIASVVGSGANEGVSRRLVAIGWATVESDRATTTLADALGIEASAFVPATGSTVLGPYAVVAPGVLEGAVDLAVVEPSTEGRLAAHLARHGEGPTIAWLADAAAAPPVASPDGSSARDGPFGLERVLAAPPDGLLRLLVMTAPGTISR